MFWNIAALSSRVNIWCQCGQINIARLTHHFKYRTAKSVTICINSIQVSFPKFSTYKQDSLVKKKNPTKTRGNPFVKGLGKMFYFAIGVDNLYFLSMQFHKNKECMQLYFSSKSEVPSQFSSCIFPVENKQTNKQHHNKN